MMNSISNFFLIAIMSTWSSHAFSASIGHISFLNESNLMVGSGRFEYNPAETIYCRYNFSLMCFDSEPSEEEKKDFIGTHFSLNTNVENLSINFPNPVGPRLENFNSGSSLYYLNDSRYTSSSYAGAYFSSIFSGTLTLKGFWEFIPHVNPNHFESSLSMNGFIQNSDTSWSGNWRVLELGIVGFPPAYEQGTFNITIIPVPGALLLFFSGLVATVAWKQKKILMHLY